MQSVRQLSQEHELAHGVLVEERRSRVVAPVAGDHAPAFLHEFEGDVDLREGQIERCGERIERHALAPAPGVGTQIEPGAASGPGFESGEAAEFEDRALYEDWLALDARLSRLGFRSEAA